MEDIEKLFVKLLAKSNACSTPRRSLVNLSDRLARLRLRPTSPEGAPVDLGSFSTSFIAAQAAGGLRGPNVNRGH